MVRVEDSVVMNFKVDALGFRRFKEVVGQYQRWFVYDLGASETPGLAPLVAEYDQSGNLVAKYHHDGGGLIAMTRNNQSYWHVFEGIGTVRQLVNAKAQVTDTYAFDAWGNELTTPQSQVQNPFRYVGKHGYFLDTESALMLLGVRYYSAANGLFLSRDLVEGYNYIYTADNPVRWIDPQGLTIQAGIVPIACATACACTGLGLLAIVGGCAAGCWDAGNLNWRCIGQCIIDTAEDMFLKGNIPPGYATCLIICGLCLIKPLRPITVTIICFLWAEHVCYYIVLRHYPWWLKCPYSPAYWACVRQQTLICMRLYF